MTWRQTIGSGQASFRGVKFFVDSVEYQGGRRTIEDEFPLRDDPFQDDVGRKARVFPVEGRVQGDDYIDQRDALIAMLEKPGPGELIHPYYGKRTVVVPGFGVRESTDSGGVALFRIEFRDAPLGSIQPTVKVDTASALTASIAAAQDSVLAEFLNTTIPGGNYVASLQTMIQRIANVVAQIVIKANMAAAKVASFNQTVVNLIDNTIGLIHTPINLFQGLVAMFENTEGMFTHGQLAYDLDPGPVPTATTPERAIERTNFLALQRATQRLVVLSMAADAANQTFDSYDQAIAGRDSITALLDEQAETASDDTFPALTDVRTALVQAIPGPDLDLPRLLSYTTPAPIPSLVLAFQLYGSVDLEQDIIDRNDVRDPAVVFGTLRVLRVG